MSKYVKDEPILFCDAASGVYIPQRFATEVVRDYVRGVDDRDYKHRRSASREIPFLEIEVSR